MSWQALTVLAVMFTLLGGLLAGMGAYQRDRILQSIALIFALLAAASYVLAACAAWPA